MGKAAPNIIKHHSLHDRNARMVIGKVYKAGVQNGAWKSADFVRACNDAGIDIVPNTLSRWSQIKDSKSTAENTVRISKVSELQKRLLAGYFLYRSERDKISTTTHGIQFVRKHFGLKLSRNSVKTYLKKNGVTSRLTLEKTGGFQYTVTQEAEIMHQWLINARQNELKDVLPNDYRLHSLDVTYTPVKKEYTMTYGPTGGSKSRNREGRKIYTNAILTQVQANGSVTVMIFSRNPHFNFAAEWLTTARRGKVKRRVEKQMRVLGIHNNEIIYVSKNQVGWGKSTTYARECPQMFFEFLQRHPLAANSIILRDKGRCYLQDGSSIFEGLTELVYPPAVHQYFSPNDNKLHARKNILKAQIEAWDDDAGLTLKLASIIKNTPRTQAQKWFNDNMQLKHQIPSLKRCLDIINHRDPKLRKVQDAARKDFEDYFIKKKVPSVPEHWDMNITEQEL